MSVYLCGCCNTHLFNNLEIFIHERRNEKIALASEEDVYTDPSTKNQPSGTPRLA